MPAFWLWLTGDPITTLIILDVLAISAVAMFLHIRRKP